MPEDLRIYLAEEDCPGSTTATVPSDFRRKRTEERACLAEQLTWINMNMPDRFDNGGNDDVARKGNSRSPRPSRCVNSGGFFMGSYQKTTKHKTSRRIVVSGEGEATAMPDLAIMTLGVVREAPTAREALDANNKAMAKVIAAMKASGVADRDLQTARVQIHPRYDYLKKPRGTQETKLVAYMVSNTLTVRVRYLSEVGELFDKAVTLGVNEGGGLAFINDDVSAMMTEARKEAVADALEKAKIISEAAGVKLAEIIDISEGFARQPRHWSDYERSAQRSMRMDSEAPVPIEIGENSCRVQVNITFELN